MGGNNMRIINQSESANRRPIRVLHSFPLKLGGPRICGIAWHQVNGVADAGAEVRACAGVLCRSLPAQISFYPTLSWGRFRIPYRVLGRIRAGALHDYRVSRKVEQLAGQIDLIHTWPLGALRTLKTAAKLGIPTVLERCNAHTRFAYEVVQKECDRLGVPLPPDHEHFYNREILCREEEEYRLAQRLLCPSDFVVKTFLDQGFPPEKLLRHIYGFDPKVYYPGDREPDTERGLTMLFVGVCAVRKGVHFALDAWLQSPAHRNGVFQIAGEFLPAYAQKLSSQLAHPSVKVLGHRTDVADLMRKSDILVLPSIEEGFGLVVVEAMASGCVPLISNACTDICQHMENGLVHQVGDVKALTQHITLLHENRDLLEKFRAASVRAAAGATWSAAGVRLLQAYREAMAVKTRLQGGIEHSEDLALV